MRWKVSSSAYAFVSRWLKVRKDKVILPSEVEIDDFYVVELADWVNVVAVTEEGEIIIEEQYRHGIGKVCKELPAGMVEERENPEEAARRELREETGYVGGVWVPYGECCPNASGMNNKCYSFLARGVRRVGNPELESSEDIRVHTYKIEEVKRLIENGSICESVMLVPLWRYFHEMETRKLK